MVNSSTITTPEPIVDRTKLQPKIHLHKQIGQKCNQRHICIKHHNTNTIKNKSMSPYDQCQHQHQHHQWDMFSTRMPHQQLPEPIECNMTLCHIPTPSMGLCFRPGVKINNIVNKNLNCNTKDYSM